VIKPLLYERELVTRIQRELPSAKMFRIATAMVSPAGVDELYPSLERCLERGGSGRILIGVDLPSDPNAIERLRKLSMKHAGYFELKYFRPLRNRIFHLKLFIFGNGGSRHSAIVGSSNVTAGGLIDNHEANIWVQSGSAVDELTEYFDEHFEGAYSSQVTPEWLDEYREGWALRKRLYDRLRKLRRKKSSAVFLPHRNSNFPKRIKDSLIVFTGRIPNSPRRELYPLVRRLGGDTAEIGGVARASCLVHAELPRGFKTTRKLRRARKVGIPVITEEAFWSLVSKEKALRRKHR